MTDIVAETYTREEIEGRAIPAKCSKCGYDWVGRDRIYAPSLRNCYCFWCGGKLKKHPAFKGFLTAEDIRRGKKPQLVATPKQMELPL